MKNKYFTIPALLVLIAVGALAFTLLGHHIFASSFAQDPTNVLDSDGDYAVLLASDANVSCPSNWDKNGSHCDYNARAIQGWLVVDFTAANKGIFDTNHVDINHSNFNLNCTTDCNASDSFLVFSTPSLSGSVNWTYLGTCTAASLSAGNICTKPLGGTIEGILVGRANVPDSYSDPAIHWIKIAINDLAK